MALGVTMTLPEEDDISWPASISRTRCACAWAGGSPSCSSTASSTGAADDCSAIPKLARRMVPRVGHVQGDRSWPGARTTKCFLGEDSCTRATTPITTSKVIGRRDRAHFCVKQESRADRVLTLHRRGLESLTRALARTNETVDGAEAARLIDEANGEPVPARRNQDGQRVESHRQVRASKEAHGGSGPRVALEHPAPAPNWQPPKLRRLRAPPRTPRAGLVGSVKVTTSEGFDEDTRIGRARRARERGNRHKRLWVWPPTT